jgi:hypothetical protein
MPIRNPFRRAGLSDQPDDAHRNTPENEFKSTTLSGATPLQVKDPAEYKLSEINDSGVYLPVRPDPQTHMALMPHARELPSEE